MAARHLRVMVAIQAVLLSPFHKPVSLFGRNNQHLNTARAGEALGYMVRKGYPVQDILEASKSAGKELVRTGRISEENLRIISRELVPLKRYVEMTNEGFKRVLDKLHQAEAGMQNS